MKNGETAVRTGVGNNGWSRIIYNGQTVYCVSNYLTTDLSYVTPQETESEFKTKFTDVSENVTAKEVTKSSQRPSVESPSEVIAELKNGGSHRAYRRVERRVVQSRIIMDRLYIVSAAIWKLYNRVGTKEYIDK